MSDSLRALRSMGDDEAVEYINETYTSAQTAKAQSIDRCMRYLDMYQALDVYDERLDKETNSLETDENIWSNTYLPVVAARVDTAVCNHYNTLFSTAEYLRYDPDDDADSLVAMKISAHILSLHKETKFKHVAFLSLLGCHCFDYAVTMTNWRLEGGYIPQRNIRIESVDLGGYKMPRRKIDMDLRWVPDKIDRPEVSVIDYFKCYHDWNAKIGFEDSSFFIDVYQMEMSELEDMAQGDDNPLGVYYNVGKIREKVLEENGWLNTSSKKPIDPAIVDNPLYRTKKVDIVRCHTKHHIAHMCGEIIIRRQDTFDWMVDLWRCYHNPGRFAGMGLIQRAERMQYDINGDVNQRRNLYNLVTDPVFAISSDLESLSGSTTLFPGKCFTFDSERNAEELIHVHQPSIGPPPNAMQDLGLEISMIDDITGINENMLGNFASGRRTAREVSNVASGSASRFMCTSDMYEELVLESIYMKEFKLSQLLMTRAARFKHYGEEGVYSVVVTPEDYKLTGSGRFRAKGSKTLRDDAIKTQQFMSAMQFVVPFQQYHNIPAILKELWMHLSPENAAKFVKDPAANAHNIPQQIEIEIMIKGRTVQVSPANNDQEHLQILDAYMNSPDYQILPESRKRLFENHKAAHSAQLMQGMAQVLGGGQMALSPGGEERVSQGMSGVGLRGVQ